MSAAATTGPETVGIRFGVAAGTIAEQLAAQGFSPSAEQTGHWQKDSDAITRLFLRQRLTTKEADRARQRLVDAIARELSEDTLACPVEDTKP